MKAARAAADIEADPFGERPRRLRRWRTRVLGAHFEFRSESAALLDLARHAFDGVPAHRLPEAPRETLRVLLRQVPDRVPQPAIPPRLKLGSGAGLLFGHSDANSFVMMAPDSGEAIVQVGDHWLRHPELLRYELIEFAAITLATRAQRLVSLHAACVGWRGRGVLLMGGSGAGKSTLALHAALEGLEYLAEDSVFVEPASLRATGFSAFVHARDDALALIRDHRLRREVAGSPLIQRRSGVRKREFDLRNRAVWLAPRPLQIAATVVLSPRRALRSEATPLGRARLRRAIRAEQGFALRRSGWDSFEARLLRAEGFELGRLPPREAVEVLRGILDGLA